MEMQWQNMLKKTVVSIKFFENLDETGIDGATDLNDEGNLNLSGATKMADYLGRFIVENYNI